MKSGELENFSARVSEHLFDHILPFWCGPALDEKNGGWMSWLSNDLKPDRSQPKGLIVHARILWTFSAVCQTRLEPIFYNMAHRAFDFLTMKFWDEKFGGAFWRLNDEGQIVDDSKKIYGQAFYIYALAEFYRAFKHPTALTHAQKLFELIEHNAHDEKFGGYFEVCNRDWSAATNARLSERDLAEKKSMNNQLHLLEAFTNLYRVWRDARVAERLRELIEIFLTRILDARTKHLHHFFDEQWRVRSDTYTFGHDIESGWLLCEAAEVLNDAILSERVRATALEIAEKVFSEGLNTSGGLCYEGKNRKIIDAGCEWWPQAEALVGFLNAFEISRDEKFFGAATCVWDFIEQKIIDRVHGEWFWRINDDGTADITLPKVSEWKGPYHNSRACLETIHRLEKIKAMFSSGEQ